MNLKLSTACGGAVTACCTVLLAALASAEEGGSGHYFPGSMSSFIDAVPAEQGVVLRLNVLDYQGELDGERAIPIAGLAALNVDVDSSAVALTALWRPVIDLGERWSFATAVTVPYIDLTVAADVVARDVGAGPTLRRSDSVSGLGDVMLFPVMLNYQISPALAYNARLGIYAPTGDYEVGTLANEGKNFWSIEPTVAMVYLSPETGRELSAYAGLTYNTENNDTNYQSGMQAHLEITAAQHFPLAGGVAGLGLSGFVYEQINGDSGSGATFGDFKARSLGAGPVASYVYSLDNTELIAELKWLHEFEVRRRPEGDTVFLKVVLRL